MQQGYQRSPRKSNQKRKPANIPGGVYTISPLATASIWAALKLKLIAWHHLRVWIALHEVRTWRDTQDRSQRNIFRFTPRRVAQAMGCRNVGPRLKITLTELQQLGLARLIPAEVAFTTSLDDLPPGLAAETERMLNSLGNKNVTRAIRMPRRLMRLVMKSRSRPVRVAVLFGMLLRIMSVKRYGWYKGCLTTALLVDVSGFHESSIKRERATLIREGYFERLETPGRARKQFGDWYSLAHSLPTLSGPKTEANRRPLTTQKEGIRRPLIKKPVPSFGIETNQFLLPKPGASRSLSNHKPTKVPSWHHIQPEDLRDPQRRADLHEDACRIGAIGRNPADRLKFYAAIARARRLGTLNPCGMLRRIVQNTVYHRYIADCDEDQARAWLRDLEPEPVPALLALVTSQAAVDSGPTDVEVYRTLARGLMTGGYDPTDQKAYHVLKQIDRSNVLKGWTPERWEAAKAEELRQRLRQMSHHPPDGPVRR